VIKVAVLYGGQSAEREVSLNTGKAVYQALMDAGFTAGLIDVSRNVAAELQTISPDVAFIALHGPGGEDGAIQGLLETIGIPYTGSGVLASAMAMDKIVTKRILDVTGIATAAYAVFDSGKDNLEENSKVIRKNISGKLVVKAPNQGSSIGIYFVEPQDNLENAIKEALKYDKKILIERFISGIEVTASVIGNDKPEVLPLIEIVSHTGVYDYKAKYTKGLSDHVIPARITQDATKVVEKLSVETYRALGCKGLARVDFMVTEEGDPFVLEVNTIPGMTETSLFPDAARAAGRSFPELVAELVRLAME